MNRFVLSVVAVLVAFLFAPAPASAHSGFGPATGFFPGLLHPVGGIDHLCTMVAVGIWSAQQARRATWAVPLAFVGTMALGGALGMTGRSLPGVEQVLAASVLVLGLLISFAARLPLAIGVLLVGMFGLFHGHAHGAETPLTASGAAYGAGFVAASAALVACGAAIGLWIKKLERPRALRFAGAAFALCGLALFATR